MPLIQSGVARFSIVGDLAGEQCVNVLDANIDTDTGVTREEACFAVAGDILNNWTDHILPNVSAIYTALSVNWVDLNSEDGSVGSRTETSAQTWPQTGARGGAPLPNNTYARVQKVLQGKSRQQRNGTLRLGGILEEDTVGGNENNNIAPAAQTAFNTAFENLKDGINGGGLGSSVNLVMVHTVNGAATGESVISTFQVQPVVGTLRRRMPGYGS